VTNAARQEKSRNSFRIRMAIVTSPARAPSPTTRIAHSRTWAKTWRRSPNCTRYFAWAPLPTSDRPSGLSARGSRADASHGPRAREYALRPRFRCGRACRCQSPRVQNRHAKKEPLIRDRYYARARTLLTDFAYHRPPRGVLMPRALRASAI
jgi:hypothetical protein